MRERYNHPKASLLHLKTWMVDSEVVETLLIRMRDIDPS